MGRDVAGHDLVACKTVVLQQCVGDLRDGLLFGAGWQCALGERECDGHTSVLSIEIGDDPLACGGIAIDI